MTPKVTGASSWGEPPQYRQRQHPFRCGSSGVSPLIRFYPLLKLAAWQELAWDLGLAQWRPGGRSG